MKKLLIFLTFFFILVGCTVEEEPIETSFSVYNDLIYLDLNEGMLVPIEFINIEQDQIVVSFSNESILDYDETDISIRAKKYGHTQIYIEVLDTDYKATIDVYVEAKEVKTPKFVASNTTINLANSFTFFLEDEEKVGAARENFEFTLSDEELAEMDENLIIKPKKPGILTITAKLKSNPEITSSFDVKIVEETDDERIIFTTDDNIFKIKPGERLKTYVDGEVKSIVDKFEYRSYNNNIASIADDGTIIGTKPGLAYVRVLDRTTRKTGYLYVIVEGTENKVDYIEKLISAAMGELGTKEVNKYVKYGDWYLEGFGSYDWCQMFVSWAANQAGIPNNIIPRTPGVASSRDFFEKQNRFKLKEDYTPKRGDIIHFLTNASHVGIVTDVRDGKVYTVEGNTSNMVAERSYSLDHHTITGYGIPNYESLNF